MMTDSVAIKSAIRNALRCDSQPPSLSYMMKVLEDADDSPSPTPRDLPFTPDEDVRLARTDSAIDAGRAYFVADDTAVSIRISLQTGHDLITGEMERSDTLPLGATGSSLALTLRRGTCERPGPVLKRFPPEEALSFPKRWLKTSSEVSLFVRWGPADAEEACAMVPPGLADSQ